jgi:transposase
MFKKTDPQRPLFGVETQLHDSLKTRLKGSWAHLFNSEILPILLQHEDAFSSLYGTTGRPNFSVARVLGLCFLQELNNMSDQQALDAFGFDIRWRYALDVKDEDAYLSRRSLVEFRRRLTTIDPNMDIIRAIFDQISKTAIKKLGLSTKDQRVDSTHIVSNICTRGRLDLFDRTIKVFIKSLDKSQFGRIPNNIQRWYRREPDGWFGLGPAERQVKLEQLARYLNKLIILFKNDKPVVSGEPYQLLIRLFNEQCDVIQNKSSKSIKVKRRTKGETLQSPFDPDASYGHKGSGYSAHITETCNNKDKQEIITDYEVHGAGRSDVGKAPGILDRLQASELIPQTLYADGGYPSVPSALKVTKRNVEFMVPVNRSRLPDEVMGRDQFEFDRDGFVIQCPIGHKPVDHRIRSSNNKKKSSLHAIFDGNLCRKCSKLDTCPVRAPNHRARGCQPRDTVGDFRLEITPQLRLRDQMYADQQTDEWKHRYKIRSGIEATMSELKRGHGMARLRVRRLPKVQFAVACKVIACNIKRWAKAQTTSNFDPNGLIKLLLSLLAIFSSLASRIWHFCFGKGLRQCLCDA